MRASFGVFEKMIRCAAMLAPARHRADWIAEWQSELWYVLRVHRCGRWESLRFALGAFRDALWVRRERAGSELPLQSPFSCLALLLGLAVVTVSVFIEDGGTAQAAIMNTAQRGESMFRQVLPFGCALLILPAVTNLGLGRMFQVRRTRWRTMIFSALKCGLGTGIVFFGALDVVPASIRPLAMIVGYVLALRWAVLDHRRRCPVCLRVLVPAAKTGRVSATFLGCYGTELCCDRGHGSMHDPAAMTSYSTQRWLGSA